MRNRLSGRLDRLSSRSGAAALLATLGVAVCLVSADTARSQSADCQRLRQEITESSRNSQSAQYQAAAEKQRAEIDRTVAYAHSIGCEKRQFLFFGSPPPAECGPLNAQDGPHARQSRRFAGPRGRGPGRTRRIDRPLQRAMRERPCSRPQSPGSSVRPAKARRSQGRAADLPRGSTNRNGRSIPTSARCARARRRCACAPATGRSSPFPIRRAAGSWTAWRTCAVRSVRTRTSVSTPIPSSGEIEQAVSISGARYIDSPNALQYRKTFDSSCSCRRRGQSWAEALANAEIKLGREDKTDIIVTPEKSAELSRPKPDPKIEAKSDPKAKSTKPIAAPTPVAAPAPRRPRHWDRRLWGGSESEPAGRHHQSRDVGHRGRRGEVGRAESVRTRVRPSK